MGADLLERTRVRIVSILSLGPDFIKVVRKRNLGPQACHISGFRPEIIGFFIALPALRLSRENLRRNHNISGIYFSDNILKFTDKIIWIKRQLKSHFTAR